MKKVILASGSSARKDLLSRLNIPFSCITSDIDESPMANEANQELVIRLGKEKALAVAAHSEGDIFIGSDQLAVCDGQIIGKPGTVENAVRQLKSFSGKKVTFLTSLFVFNKETGSEHSYLDTTHVEFRDLTEEEIITYIKAENPLQCAGSFKSEGLGISLFTAIYNQDPTALMGLPMIKLCEYLRAESVNLLD